MGRELNALGQSYRNDWSDFDGRTLRSQLGGLVTWSFEALKNGAQPDFTYFSDSLKEQEEDF